MLNEANYCHAWPNFYNLGLLFKIGGQCLYWTIYGNFPWSKVILKLE